MNLVSIPVTSTRRTIYDKFLVLHRNTANFPLYSITKNSGKDKTPQGCLYYLFIKKLFSINLIYPVLLPVMSHSITYYRIFLWKCSNIIN